MFPGLIIKLLFGLFPVPPSEAIIMDEYGQHLEGLIGPYNEGFPLALACEGEGGDPSPAVCWLRNAELLDDSYYITPQGFPRNELLLSSLKRTDLMSSLTCQVSNSNLSAPVTSTVVIDMNLKPTEVHITTACRDHPHNKHDNQRNLSCKGDNPQLPDSILEDTWVLDIHFPPELEVKINKPVPVFEGTDVQLSCISQAHPPIVQLQWLKDGQ
ncbi:uncharacterized protein CDAR_188751 [Caerostris darwini]|uniref:Ig-like domain-containing protein n=1 Tax=Caerostris darwini TaxID=1538125 RepID=A0AAV4VMP0_9ARAC|nr:uncharacterized protein CDAR_188751 [Caerostris darwini]